MIDHINTSIDSDLKNAAVEVFNRLGITEDEAIRLFYTRVKIEQGMPFKMNNPNNETIAALKEAENQNSLTYYENFSVWEQTILEGQDSGD